MVCWRRGTAWLLAAAVGFSASVSARAQVFQSQGPGPAFGDGNIVQSVDSPPNGSSSGAVTALLPSQTDANTMLIGSANGGIWLTTNGGQSWTSKSDFAPSLSIAALAYDSSNPRTIYAGIGLVSNGAMGPASSSDPTNRGGDRIGLLRSVDGGNSWSTLPDSVVSPLSDKSVVGVASNGSFILAATSEPQSPASASAAGYGLYRSDGTSAFTLVNNGTGVMPTGAATSLVGKGTAASPYYVAIANGGVYRSADGGATWQATGLSFGANQSGRLAAGPGGAVAVAIYDNRDSTSGGGKLISVQISPTGSGWSSYTVASGQVPQVNNGSQATTNLSIGIDPNNGSIVYIAGDTGGNVRDSPKGEDVTIPAYRLVRQADGSLAVTPLTGSSTANNSTIHADSRAFAFDVNGRMFLASDGGIYARTSPQSTTGSWSGLNGNLSVREPYAIAYDGLSKRLLVAAQDNGVAFQTTARGLGYTAVGGGDGLNAAINDRTYADKSILYFSSQSLGFLTRLEVNGAGQVTSNARLLSNPTKGEPVINFLPQDFTDGSDPDPNKKELPFGSRLVLNRNDPRMIVIGTNFVYTTTDGLLADVSNTTPLTNVSGTSAATLGGVTALAYGTTSNANALLVGGGNGLFYTSSATTGNALAALGQYTTLGGLTPLSVVFDARSDTRFFAADGSKLWYGTGVTGGGTFADLTPRLTALDISRPTAVEFISNNGVNAVFAGGLNTSATAASGSPIAFANVASDGTLPANFTSFGIGLPNTIVNQLAYNSRADLLAVSLYGRGLWTVYDVTSYFSSAQELRFGLADNDSSPDGSLLTNGDYTSRALVKSGAGTLTLSADASYTGSTTVKAGTMLANASLASSSGLTIEAPGTVRGAGTLPLTTVSGTLWPGNNGIGTLTVKNGLTFNPSALYKLDVSPSASSIINVTGGAAAVTLNGGVQVMLQPGNYSPKVTFDVLNTTGTLTGRFAGAVSNYPFLQPTLSYGIHDVFLNVAPGGFAAGAATPSQAAVGAVLDRNVATASGDFADVINAFSLLTTSQAQSAFQAIGGQNYAGFSSLGVQTSQLFMNFFSLQAGGAQTTGGGGGGGRLALAEACDVACDVGETPRWSAWGGPVGGVGTIAGSTAAPGQNFNIGGFAAGIDRRFDGGLLFGATAGYTVANQYTQTMPGQGTANTVQLGFYGEYASGSFYLDALAGYAHSANQMTRPIAVPGLAQRTAYGKTTTEQFFGWDPLESTCRHASLSIL